MKAALLEQVGRSVFGDRWKTDLARELGVTYRTLQRWCVAGVCPDDVRAEVRVVLRRRIEAAEAARKLLWSKS